MTHVSALCADREGNVNPILHSGKETSMGFAFGREEAAGPKLFSVKDLYPIEEVELVPRVRDCEIGVLVQQVCPLPHIALALLLRSLSCNPAPIP